MEQPEPTTVLATATTTTTENSESVAGRRQKRHFTYLDTCILSSRWPLHIHLYILEVAYDKVPLWVYLIVPAAFAARIMYLFVKGGPEGYEQRFDFAEVCITLGLICYVRVIKLWLGNRVHLSQLVP